MVAERRQSGRPRMYEDPIFFEEKVEQYFDECARHNKPPTLAGVSYYMGFYNRESFMHYANYEGFSRTVKRTRLRIEAAKNEMLFSKDYSTAGVIFDLKNNHGWSDRVEVGSMTPSEFGNEVERCLADMERATGSIDQADDDAEMV